MKHYHLEEIGSTIRAERAKRNLSQNALGNLVGIQGQNISLIELGKQKISVKRLNLILSVFNMEVSPFRARKKKNK